MFFMVYPQMLPGKGQPVGSMTAEVNRGAQRESPSTVGSVSTANAALKAEIFESRIFGFRAHEEAQLIRWRTVQRDE
jgi:casein kinase II subunit beta